MKRMIMAVVLALAAGAVQAQDTLMGDWRTAPDDNGNTGIIRIVQCGSSLCGTLVQSFDSSGGVLQTENTGRQIIWDTNPTSTSGEYRGKLWAPDRDATYNSRLYLNGNSLSVCGRLLGIERCGGDWVRVN